MRATIDAAAATASAGAPLRATPLAIGLLTALAALGQFASNVYTPSLPAVARDLGVGAGEAQLTLAVFLAAFGLAQLVHGPLSDRFGRRPVLLAGLAVFLAGTGLCAAAGGIGALLVGRAVQAAGAAAGVVASRAVLRDSFEGAELARAMALVTIAFALVPGLTPLVGGVVQTVAGWRGTFLLTLAVGAAVAALAWAALPETNRRPLARLDLAAVVGGYAATLRSAAFVRHAVPVALVFASMSAFFAGSPALFIERLGVSPIEYGLYPPIAVSGFVVGGLALRRLAGWARGGTGLVGPGLAVMLAGALVIAVPPALGLVHEHLVTAGMVLHVTGLGIVMPAAMAAALEPFRERAGTAAAAIGFFQMAAGAAGAAAVSLLQPAHPVLAFPLVMAVATALAGIAFALLPAESRSREPPSTA